MLQANPLPPLSRQSILLSAGILSLVLLAFVQGAWFDFTSYDDPEWVANNQVVQGGLKASSLGVAFSRPILGHWAPLTVLSHMAVCQFFGLKPGAHHLVNIALHGLAAVILFHVLRRMTGGMWRSLVVAAFFAVHPLRAESVMWVAERKDVLSGLFFFLSLGAYASWTRHPGIIRYLWLTLLVAAGLMSKSMLVSLPGVLLLLDLWPLGRLTRLADGKSRVVEKLPFFAMAIATAIVQYSTEPKMMASLSTLSVGARLGNAVVTYAIYAGQLFWPVSLCAFYPHEGMPPAGQIVAALVALMVVTAIVVRYGRQHQYLWVGWLWYLGMLLPVIGLVQAGEIGRADRYTYLPHVGLLIMLVWGAEEVTRKWPRRRWVLGLAAGVGIVLAVFFTRLQAATWRNEETLWSHALAVSPDNYRAHYSLGVIEGGRGNFKPAMVHFKECARLLPGDWHAFSAQGRILLATGDVPGAFDAARAAILRNPAETAFHFAREFERVGFLAGADWCLEEATKVSPNDAEPAFELAMVRYQTGRDADAVQLYESVLKRNDTLVPAQANLAWILATSVHDSVRNGPEAVQWASRANQSTGGADPMVLRILAAAYAEAGQYPEAVAASERGMASAQQRGDAKMAAWFQGQSAMFRAHTPLRISSGPAPSPAAR